jgi:hypothetical protein
MRSNIRRPAAVEPARVLHAVDGAREGGAVDGGELGELGHGAVLPGVERGQRAPFRHPQPELAQALGQLAVARADDLGQPEEGVAVELELHPAGTLLPN